MKPEPETPVVTRPATRADEARIAELAAQLGYPSSPEQVSRRLGLILSDPAHGVFVAEIDGERVAGWVHAFLYRVVESDLRAEIGGLVVDERFRGKGVGGALMGRAEAWARERGCTDVSLRSNVIRERAHAFYQNLGYTLVKTQHAFRKKI